MHPPQGNVKLNPTQGTILGVLADGPKTGWDVLREFEAGLARFWNVTPSHVYRELRALDAQELIVPGPSGPRDRRPYSLTAAGRRAFKAWIAQPPASEQIRFPLLVTLWFGRHLDEATRAAFIASSRVEHERRLEMYSRLQPDDPHVAAVLGFGLAYEQAVVGWLDSLARPESVRSGPAGERRRANDASGVK